MADTELDILDLNDEVLVQAYQGNNYQCFDTGINSDICYILFSSNGLYYPNTRETFVETITERDRYEWKWVVKNSHIPQRAGRIIYVRDIYKCWYAKGINVRQDTVDKTLELLKELTKDYRVITIGSSAGGYMAVLTAVELNAMYCFNFSGQYLISDNLGNPYYDLTERMKAYQGEIYYFFPAHCEADRENYDRVKEMKCIKAFLFNTSRHAETMLTGNMCHIVDRTKEEMQLLYRKYEGGEINKFQFLMKTVSLLKVVGIIWKEAQGFFTRLRGKHWVGV